MSLTQFQHSVTDKGIGPGARWRKADFHVHLPTSSDYEYKDPDAFEKLGKALTDEGYSFAIILKHEEFPTREELASLQRFCPQTTLIPGAEINVLVDTLFKKIGKDYFGHCIVAVDPDQAGEYGYVLRKAQETLSYRKGDYPAGFRSSILDVGRFFRSNGALFFPAHLHQAKTPEQSRSLDDLYTDESFLGFISDGAFDALEVRQKETASFFDGSRTTQEGLKIPAAVCVASSDAHHHDHIPQRNRGTWVRVESRTYAELVAALSFPHRVSLDKPSDAHSRIVGMHVVGSFVPESWIGFNESLNALIGAKGSGKTALLECLRFVLNTKVPADRVENVRRHVSHVLGSSGYVECLVQKEGGERYLVTRRADSPDRIVLTDEAGVTKVVNASEGPLFPVSILGWHEIEAVADQADARISLLDRIGNPREIQTLYEEIKQLVERARDHLPTLQRQIKHLDALLQELWDLRKKRNALARLEKGDLLDLQRQYEWFLQTEQKIEGLRADLDVRKGSVSESTDSHLTVDIGAPPDVAAAGKAIPALADVTGALDSNRDNESKTAATLDASLARVQDVTAAAAAKVTESFAEFREGIYTPKVNALPPEDREILTKQIQVLEETKRLPLVEKQCVDLLAEVTSLSNQLRDLCQQVCSKRDQIVAIREALVAALNAELDSVQLRFLRSANQQARNRFQTKHGADGASFVGYLQGFGKLEAYQNLIALFEYIGSLRIDQGDWNVKEILWDVRFLDLLDVADDDDVEISLQVGKGGLVTIQNLSAGQRCVAVFPLLLRNTRGPLVIDQPEDNLDNRYIADIIAPDLLRRKQRQQFLVTSHNANLVVLTDADFIVHVDSDGATCRFPAAGFFACSSSGVGQSVLDVLDGGAAALAARQRKYGIGA